MTNGAGREYQSIRQAAEARMPDDAYRRARLLGIVSPLCAGVAFGIFVATLFAPVPAALSAAGLACLFLSLGVNALETRRLAPFIAEARRHERAALRDIAVPNPVTAPGVHPAREGHP